MNQALTAAPVLAAALRKMAPFVYRCPNTGLRVQGFIAEDPLDDGESYEAITCLACRRLHLVNPVTGRVLGEDDE